MDEKHHPIITWKHAPPIVEWPKLFRNIKHQTPPFINSEKEEIAHWRRSLLVQLHKDLQFKKVSQKEQKYKLRETQVQLSRLVVGENWLAFQMDKFNGIQRVCRTLFEFVPTWRACYIVENDCQLKHMKTEYNIFTPNESVQTELVSWIRPFNLIYDKSLQRWLVDLFVRKISRDCVLHICTFLAFQ